MNTYRVTVFNNEGYVVFDHKVSAANKKAALNFFHYTYGGFNERANTINLAFALSGGVTVPYNNKMHKIAEIKIEKI